MTPAGVTYVDGAGGQWILVEKSRDDRIAVVKVRRVDSDRSELLAAPPEWSNDPGEVVGRAFHGQLKLVE